MGPNGGLQEGKVDHDTYDDVVHIGFVDLGRRVDVDLDPVLCVVLLDGSEQRTEPLGG